MSERLGAGSTFAGCRIGSVVGPWGDGRRVPRTRPVTGPGGRAEADRAGASRGPKLPGAVPQGAAARGVARATRTWSRCTPRANTTGKPVPRDALRPGHDLRTLLQRDGPLGPELRAAHAAQTAGALDAATAGFVHRDVKPANVLLRRGRGTPTSPTSASPSSSATSATAPARARWITWRPSRSAASRSTYHDVYALAGVLYECLAGVPPVPAPDARQRRCGRICARSRRRLRAARRWTRYSIVGSRAGS